MYHKVKVSNPFICSLKLHFSGKFERLNFTGEAPIKDMRFYESLNVSPVGVDSYFSSGSFSFAETLENADAGTFYRQEAIFKFPSNDPLRSQRIESFKKVKFIEMILNDGRSFIMGRNDITQNVKPLIRTNSNLQITEVRVITESILPVSPIYKSAEPLIGYDYIYNFELS